MSKATIKGRQALSTKTKTSMFSTEDIFGNTLKIGPELQKELDEKGLVGRWVNGTRMHAMQGQHARGWRAYKRSSDATISTEESLFGASVDGLIRRGDCVLAVKKAEEVKAHQDHLAQKAARYKRYSKEQAAELRQMAQSQGAATEVDETYGKDDEDEQD